VLGRDLNRTRPPSIRLSEIFVRSRFSIAFCIRVLIVLALHVCVLALLVLESKQELVREPEVVRLEVQMLTLPSPQPTEAPPPEPVVDPTPTPVQPPEPKPLEVPLLTTQLESASIVQTPPEPEQPEPPEPKPLESASPKPPEPQRPEPEPPKPKPPEPAPLAPKPIERKPAAPRANASTTSTTQGEPAATRSDADTPLTGARFDADYLHNPAPAYPSYSRRMKERGTVFVLVQVSAEGNALQVTLHQSSGYDRLDEAALQAVKQWRFVPAKRGATPVAASVVVPIQFKQ
jgi:protein TonB